MLYVEPFPGRYIYIDSIVDIYIDSIVDAHRVYDRNLS